MSPDIIEALVNTIELKDLSTAAHTYRVVLYSKALAEAFGCDLDTIQRVTRAAALHDVGKIDIPDEVLQKPGKLDDAEYEIIKTHAALGHERLLRMVEDDGLALELVRHHHERWDGKGYPDGLAGQQIAPAARHFAVIDTFDAMTSIRPYRREIGAEAAEKALEELHNGSGTRYCPESVELFTRLYRSGALGWILTYYNDAAQLPKFSGEPAHGVTKTVAKGTP